MARFKGFFKGHKEEKESPDLGFGKKDEMEAPKEGKLDGILDGVVDALSEIGGEVLEQAKEAVADVRNAVHHVAWGRNEPHSGRSHRDMFNDRQFDKDDLDHDL